MVTSREQIKEEGQQNKREHCAPMTSERRKTEREDGWKINRVGGQKVRQRVLLRA